MEMIDKETYKKEIVRMFNSIRDDKYKGYYDYDSATCECSGVQCCEGCAFYGIDCGSSTNAFEMIEAVEKWSKEHPPKKYQVSRLEYDILKIYVERELYGHFAEYGLLMALLKKGYFDGATGKTDVKEYFKNCEVID